MSMGLFESTRDASGLDPSKFLDVDLSSDYVVQNMQRGLAKKWATSAPFYIVHQGIVQVVACRHKDVWEIFQDRERFSSIVPKTPGIETLDPFNGVEHIGHTDGPRHDKFRGIMAPPFGPKSLAEVEAGIRALFDKKLDAIEAKGGEFDAMADICRDLISEILLGIMLQLTASQRTSMMRMHDAMRLMMQTPPGGEPPREYMEAFKESRQVVFDIIAARRANPRDDFIGRLVTARDAGVLASDEDVYGNVFAICAAGLGSTATSLAAGLMNLARNPDQYQLLRENPELVKSAVEECLRMHGAGFAGFPRFALLDTEVGGTFIPKGTPIHLNVQAADYDPDAFPNPERFDVRRNPKNILAFGAGAHVCLGSRLARMIIRVGLESVTRRFERLRLVDPDFYPHYDGMFTETMPDTVPLTVR
jgi:cytochrome P450